jgi:hypothetical protein
MKCFCLLLTALLSISSLAKQNECGDELAPLVTLRAPLVEASIWANLRFPQLDIGIILKMAAEFVTHPIPVEKLMETAHPDEIDLFLQKAREAHEAYGIEVPMRRAHQSMRDDIERLYEVERARTVEFLNILIDVCGGDSQMMTIDDFFIGKKWPRPRKLAKEITEIFEVYLASPEFSALARKLREDIRERARIGDFHGDLLIPAEDRLVEQVTALTRKQSPSLMPQMRRFFNRLRELQ